MLVSKWPKKSLFRSTTILNSASRMTIHDPKVARPIDQMSIEITIPEEYRSKPVQFAARVLEVRLPVIPNIETVVVNETTGVISMSADLEITPQVLQHQNMVDRNR